MNTTVRNVLIVLVLAAAVFALPKGDDTADLILGLLSVGILASFVAFGGRAYLEHRTTIYGLGDAYRGALYGGIAGLVFAFASVGRFTATGGGTIAWLAVIGGSIYALYRVYLHWRTLAY